MAAWQLLAAAPAAGGACLPAAGGLDVGQLHAGTAVRRGARRFARCVALLSFWLPACPAGPRASGPDPPATLRRCRVAYNLPGPPTPLALTAASGVLELMVLLAAMLLTARPQAQAAASGAGGALSDGSAAVPAAAKDEGLPLGLPPAAAAGLEIG